MLRPGVALSDMYHACRSDVEESTDIPSYPRGHVGHPSAWKQRSKVTLDHGHRALDFEPGMVVSHEMSYAATSDTPHEGSYNISDTFLITEERHERFSFTDEALESTVATGTITSSTGRSPVEVDSS